MLSYLIIGMAIVLMYLLLSDVVSFVYCYRNDRELNH